MNKQDNIASLQGHMRTLLAYLETPVLITSAAYKTAYVNPAFEQMFSVGFREALGKDISSILAPSVAEKLTLHGEEAKAGTKAVRFVVQSGSYHFSVGTSSIQNEEGRISGLVYSFTDITKERQLEQVKADFINLLLNDLRGPIIEISKSFGRIKEKMGKKPDFEDAVLSGMENAETVLGHLEQLLHITDSISGDLNLSKSDNDPGSILATVVESLKNVIRKNESVVEQYVSRRMPTWNCDHDKVMQVLIYIITEQIKAAGHGGTVSIGLDTSLRDDTPVSLFISAAQPNKTFSREDLPELFGENLSTGSTDPTRLAIRKIIEAHGGSFSLVGIDGHGCALTAAFPLS